MMQLARRAGGRALSAAKTAQKLVVDATSNGDVRLCSCGASIAPFSSETRSVPLVAKKQVQLGPNARGYIAGLLDFKGNAYHSKGGGLTAYINGMKSEAMQNDLLLWIGGGFITENSRDGDRRGCKVHCNLAHFHYTRTSVKFVFTGLRALCVLYSLEPSLHEWERKFAEPFHEAMQRIEEISTTKDGKKILDDMAARGWEVP